MGYHLCPLYELVEMLFYCIAALLFCRQCSFQHMKLFALPHVQSAKLSTDILLSILGLRFTSLSFTVYAVFICSCSLIDLVFIILSLMFFLSFICFHVSDVSHALLFFGSVINSINSFLNICFLDSVPLC